MSAVTQGILRMPPRLWSDQAIDVNQRHSTYVWAADQIVELERENAALRNKLAMYEGQTRFLCQCGGTKP
jgi:hypothetical protein